MSYGRAVWYKGIKFDSVKERNRYQELELLEYAGEIERLEVHPKFQLQKAFKCPWTGEKVQPIKFKADFLYWEGNHLICEDVKAISKKTGKILKTRDFEVRWKLAQLQNPHMEFRIVGRL